jgi:hypothetical protein
MNIFEYFSPDQCNPLWKNNWLESWSKAEVLNKQKELWSNLILVDMIWDPLPWAVSISNELFNSWEYQDWTVFVLCCHSWWSSWYVQKQLAPEYPHYKFVNLAWWVWIWHFS